ncbi:hypothetical protein [Pseudomonas putida]|uniref:hypothetical protein n=1 Tax=Pseudomonas putida TaxID=303 RepID=UPI003D966D05
MSNWKAVEIRLSTQRKNIPYATDPENDVHPVIWISKEPHRIDEIPELNRDPELKSAIQSLNSPGCRFESFRCGSIDEEDDGKFYSNFNIGLIYRDREAFANYGAQLMIAGEVLGFSTDSDIFPEGSRMFLIEIESVLLTTESVHGWTVDLWHRSEGRTAQEAKGKANQALNLLKNVLSAKYS